MTNTSDCARMLHELQLQAVTISVERDTLRAEVDRANVRAGFAERERDTIRARLAEVEKDRDDAHLILRKYLGQRDALAKAMRQIENVPHVAAGIARNALASLSPGSKPEGES